VFLWHYGGIRLRETIPMARFPKPTTPSRGRLQNTEVAITKQNTAEMIRRRSTFFVTQLVNYSVSPVFILILLFLELLRNPRRRPNSNPRWRDASSKTPGCAVFPRARLIGNKSLRTPRATASITQFNTATSRPKSRFAGSPKYALPTFTLPMSCRRFLSNPSLNPPNPEFSI